MLLRLPLLFLLAFVVEKIAADCKKLTDSCVPCFKGIQFPECNGYKTACLNVICMALCLRITWLIGITATGGDPLFVKELSNPSIKLAIQAQMLAKGQ